VAKAKVGLYLRYRQEGKQSPYRPVCWDEEAAPPLFGNISVTIRFGRRFAAERSPALSGLASGTAKISSSHSISAMPLFGRPSIPMQLLSIRIDLGD